MLESASADEKPDVYITDYAGINADTDDAYSFSVASSSSDSLKTLYNQIDAKNDDDDSKYTVAFDVMKSALEEQGKFAVSYDIPVLYVKDGSDDVSASSFSKLFASESNALLTNPNAVLDIAYSYGYTESNSDELSQIYSTAQDDAYKTFCASSKKTYYAGYISEYSEIADRCDIAFSVIPLPGANNNYIFPEVWSISDTEDSDKHKASMLFLYYMLNVSTTQQLYTELTGYMPMLLEYINSDSFEVQGAFTSVLSSANEAVTYTSSYSDIYDKSIIISKGAEKGKKFSKLELG
ncbi:MAG: hypothetical protein LUG95_04620 [Clostridiales bacterium]|nr:hypothetical protein [Clostridiales bacterium]